MVLGYSIEEYVMPFLAALQKRLVLSDAELKRVEMVYRLALSDTELKRIYIYNCTFFFLEFIGIACTALWAVQVIPMNSIVECVVLYTSPLGADTTQHTPGWSSQV